MAASWRRWFGNGVLLMLSLLWIGGAVLGVEYGARHSWLFWIEHWTGDWRTMLFSDRPKNQHPKVSVVNVTEDTLQAYPYRTPIDRDLVARLVTTIDQAGAEAIAIDYLFIKATEPDKDETLIDAIRAASARVVLAVGDERAELTEAQRIFQDDFLQRTGAKPGFANLLTKSARSDCVHTIWKLPVRGKPPTSMNGQFT